MRRGDYCIGIALGISALALLPCGPAVARYRAPAARIGVVSTLSPDTPAALLAIAMRPFRSYMEEQTGTAGVIVRGGDAFDLGRQLHEGTLQVGIFHGHEFAWAKAKYPTLEPIAVCINPLRSVRACLVVSARSTAASHADLRGGTVALPRDGRDHCRLYLDRRCVPPGVDPAAFYRRVARPSDTAGALDDVAAGRLHAAVVDAAALDRYAGANPGRARQLRIVQQSEAFPPGVIACDRGRLPAAEFQKWRQALLGAKDSPRGRQTLQLLKLATFEAPAADFDEALQAIAKAYPAPAR
jgi:ABC-type phosphate/phosphonate transport system substrate-binding protein